MSRFPPAANAYVRPMRFWWLRKSYFALYMVREGSAVFLTIYALILLAGLACLAGGQAAFNDWRALLATRPAILFHVVAFAAVLYHSVTWFQVMPKTAPRLPVAPRLITRAGLGASACLSGLILVALLWLTS